MSTSRKISKSTFVPNITKDADMHIGNLISDLISSKCPLPCTTVSVTSKLMNTGHAYMMTDVIDLIPVSSVLVTKTDFLRGSFSSLLSAYGGGMGLWLCIGIAQLSVNSFMFFKELNWARLGK